MNQWIRLYREALHNPKIVSLNDRQHRVWSNCLLMADDAGRLPAMRDIACHLRVSILDAEQVLCELIDCGLVDVENPGCANRKFKMHDWTTYQYVSDNSAERTRKYRKSITEKSSDDDVTSQKRRCNDDVTPPDSEPDSEPDTESKLLPSEQEAARAKEHGFKFGLKKGFGKDGGDGMETIVKRADGLGLDVAELIEITNRNAPKKRAAYFTTLCVNRLKGTLPGLSEQIIRDAIWGKTAQYASVCQMLLTAEAAP